jgi:hypothetical protein
MKIINDIEQVYTRNKTLGNYLLLRAHLSGMGPIIDPKLKEKLGDLYEIVTDRTNKATRGKKLRFSLEWIQNLLSIEDRQARIYYKAFNVENDIGMYLNNAQPLLSYQILLDQEAKRVKEVPRLE